MWTDIMSTDNNLTINRTAAKMFGLTTAVYISELCNILVKVQAKKTYDKSGFFKLDRRYVKERTTLGSAEQREAEQILVAAGCMMKKDDPENCICVDMQALVGLITNCDVKDMQSVVSAAKEEMKTKKQESRLEAAAKKKEAIVATMMKSAENESELVKQSLENWIMQMLKVGKGKFTSETFKIGIDTISNYSDSEKKKILDTAVANGWSNLDWIINSLNRSGQLKPKSTKEHKVSGGLSAIEL